MARQRIAPVEAYRKAHALGLTSLAAAESLGVSVKSVQATWRDLGLSYSAGPSSLARANKPLVVTDPPSRAMLALAEFDPIVRRCVRIRLGQKEEEEA